ncbi:hypothetical protein M1L60_24210 [Actinoplanes sp. TRM 88003]|uniref:Knr4/Smi1-like domain-containing protein n=1 Tax=Paractinoplanes aksuensis TaxID=2939490 RepID=A0ABT1DSA2_9ACTN|nr:hypothetical protein [Actinoplanes aksuensis]MCO8273704.1 hypothetical protein [Actinoplanes aksuensis]
MDALSTLAAVLNLPGPGRPASASRDWAVTETSLGAELPRDYKRFVDTYGPGVIDDHLVVCAPGGIGDWTDLLENNEMAQESCRIWFGGGDTSGAWPLGDSARWEGEDVPDWFRAGDDLISWGATPNGDFLYWHIRPGVAADDHPVVLRERGPYFERFEAGFAATLTGLLTGAISSFYLSRWLKAPHSYTRVPAV